MDEAIRGLGLATAAVVIGMTVTIIIQGRKGNIGTPWWRLCGFAAFILIAISGILARISLWQAPFNPRDLAFLVTNCLIIAALYGALTERTQGGIA